MYNNNNEKTSHGFEGQHEMIIRKVWREEREGRNDVIIISYIKDTFPYVIVKTFKIEYTCISKIYRINSS